MKRRIEFRPYRREFVRPLKTARGTWAIREGFLVRAEAHGRVSYGEVAPLPEFGTETVEQARGFLEQLVQHPDTSIPEGLPCCAFGLSAAWGATAHDHGTGGLEAGLPTQTGFSVAALLPAGATALEIAKRKIELGYRTLKWKIGVSPSHEEQAIFQDLVSLLPANGKLRLDANGSFDEDALVSWLECLESHADGIDFLEQPLPVGGEARMAELASKTTIKIALDESLNGRDAARWFEPDAWSGPLVVKPLLMGDAEALKARLGAVADRIVWSSVFETSIGLQSLFSVARDLPPAGFAIGFDTLDAFNDSLGLVEAGPSVRAEDVFAIDPESLWNQLA